MNTNAFIVDNEATDILFALNTAPCNPSKVYRDGIFLIEESPEGEVILRDICFDVDRNFIFSVAIPKNITVIGNNCFRECNALERVTIHSGVTRIEEGAFRDCVVLHSIVIPDSVVSIGDYCFYGCTSLESIKLSYSLKKLGVCVFGCCTNLEYLYLPDSIMEIDNSCFRHCEGLRSLAIANPNLNPEENGLRIVMFFVLWLYIKVLLQILFVSRMIT